MVQTNWNMDEELAKFAGLWHKKTRFYMDQSAAAWNGRADAWVRELTEDPRQRQNSEGRIGETVRYLKERGVLTPETDIMDIGCGPGRFVAEFAKTARSAAGTDISGRMLELAAQYASEQGLNNVSFEVCDFKKADIAALGWEKAFDVVFSSLTVAASSPEEIDKMERMSRKYCFSATFVHSEEELGQRAYQAAFPGEQQRSRRNSRGFYALFNLLWLRGRYPEIRYYKQENADLVPVDEKLIQRVLEHVYPEEITEDVKQKVRGYLLREADADNMVVYPSVTWFGWLLWDVNDHGERDYS